MSTHRYPGGIISAYPVVPNASSAVGVWTLEEALRSKAANNWPDGTGADVYFKNTTLLLHGDGTNGAQNNTFLDSSANAFTITRAGNTTQGSFDPYAGPGNWSIYFNGTTDYLTSTSTSIVPTGTESFTIEMWINKGNAWNTVNQFLFFGAPTGVQIWVDVATTSLKLSYNSALILSYSTSTLSINTWYHLAIARNGSAIAMYINGSQVASGTDSTGIPAPTSVIIGNNNTGTTNVWNGYISNLRIVRGVALYTSAFATPTTQLVSTTQTTLLNCNNNGFNDLSGGNISFTRSGTPQVSKFSPFTLYQTTPASYSGYFDGTNSNLTVPSNTALTLGSGNFTVEAWVYLSGTQTTTYGYQVLGTYPAGATPNGYALVVNRSSGGPWGLAWANGTPTSTKITYGTYLNTNTWYHIAVVRTSTATNGVTIYLNGSAVATGTDATNDSVLQTLYVGSQGAGQYFPGSISNVRITKGQALYTSNFTPSTSPLTTTSQGATAANVSLLTCQSTTFIDNSTNAFAITANGNAKPRSANPFTDTVSGPTAYSTATYSGSAYFDGAGDSLTLPAPPALAFGTGDFTWETWIYLNTLSANTYLYDTSAAGDTTSTGRFVVGAFPSGYLRLYTGALTTLLLASPAGTITTNMWTHIAITRSGTTGYMFVNGALITSGSVTTNFLAVTASGTNRPVIGANGYDLTSVVNGYFSNLRVVKGTAVYTAPFVPPAAPVTAIANTSLLLNSTNAGIFDNTTVTDLETVGNAQISTSVVKYGTGSLAFDGTGDWLTSPDQINLQFGTGDFTLECWAYPTAGSGTNRAILSKGTTTTGWSIYATSGNFWAFTDTSTPLVSTSAVALNTWVFIAVVRYGSSLKIYIDGVATASTTSSTNFNQTNQLVIGAGRDTSIPFTGYLDEVRITKGVARYTANFTPPTGPFPNI